MEPFTVPALAAVISAVIGGAGGEAGRAAWASLSRLVRKFRPGPAFTAALGGELAEMPQESDVEPLARDLAEAASRDGEFGQLLLAWVRQTQASLSGDAVANSITGGATVHGPVVQARDINGAINFG